MNNVPIEITENNHYKNKILKKTYSNLSNKKQGIIVCKGR